jgi:hypothetical protein
VVLVALVDQYYLVVLEVLVDQYFLVVPEVPEVLVDQ